MRAVLAIGPALAAFIVGSASFAQQEAVLDQCLVDPSKVQEVFDERFPHERCDVAGTCAAELVETAQVLARERCRVAALDACVAGVAPSDCLASLAKRWRGVASKTSLELKARWTAIDRATASPFAIRRFDKPETYALQTTCADLTELRPYSNVSADLICETYSALASVNRMEGLSNYLADQEARR